MNSGIKVLTKDLVLQILRLVAIIKRLQGQNIVNQAYIDLFSKIQMFPLPKAEANSTLKEVYGYKIKHIKQQMSDSVSLQQRVEIFGQELAPQIEQLADELQAALVTAIKKGLDRQKKLSQSSSQLEDELLN